MSDKFKIGDRIVITHTDGSAWGIRVITRISSSYGRTICWHVASEELENGRHPKLTYQASTNLKDIDHASPQKYNEVPHEANLSYWQYLISVRDEI